MCCFLNQESVVHIWGKLVKLREYNLAWQASRGNKLLLPSAFVDEKTETNLLSLWVTQNY